MKHDPNPILMMGDEMKRGFDIAKVIDGIWATASRQPALVNSKPAAFRPPGFDQAQGDAE